MIGHRERNRPVASMLRATIAGGAALALAFLVLSACSSQNQSGKTTTSTSTPPVSASSTTNPTSAPQNQFGQQALTILDAIVRGDFKAATANFDSTMQQALPPDKLESAWSEYQQTFGKYRSHGDPQQVPFRDLAVVNTPLQMELQPGEFRVTFHSDGTVAGLYFLKTGVPVS